MHVHVACFLGMGGCMYMWRVSYGWVCACGVFFEDGWVHVHVACFLRMGGCMYMWHVS